MEVGRLARQRRRREAYGVLLGFVFRPSLSSRIMVWIVSLLMSLSAPRDPSDLVVTIEAEDKHAFRDRLSQITAPTLVVAGADDPGHTEQLFRETAAGIPDARLILHPGMGHPASGKQFERDVLAFLREDR